jgi:hypothetical protein
MAMSCSNTAAWHVVVEVGNLLGRFTVMRYTCQTTVQGTSKWRTQRAKLAVATSCNLIAAYKYHIWSTDLLFSLRFLKRKVRL